MLLIGWMLRSPPSTGRGDPRAESKADPFLNLSLSAHSQQRFTHSGNPGTSPRALKPTLQATGYTGSGSIPLNPFMSAPWAIMLTLPVAWWVSPEIFHLLNELFSWVLAVMMRGISSLVFSQSGRNISSKWKPTPAFFELWHLIH